jgi:PBP1b-binding outer membrane lipoprotein LpoB
MKKLTTLLMMLCLGLFIVGCGGDDESATDGDAATDSVTDSPEEPAEDGATDP